MTNIVAVDSSHLLYRTFYEFLGDASSLSPAKRIAATNLAIKRLKEYQSKHKPDVFVAAFDDRKSWRTEYSKKNRLRPYKSKRVAETLKERRIRDSFNEFRSSFRNILRRAPGIVVMQGDGLESDDIIAGLAEFKQKGDKLKVVSLDHDLAHLMLDKDVAVFDMATNKQMSRRGLKGKKAERILRGRHTYNVVGVFKRLPQTVLNKVKRGTITPEVLFDSLDKNPESKMHAKTRYKHNQVLLDVTKAPRRIKQKVKKTIKVSFRNQKL